METLEAMGTRRSIRYFYPFKYVEDEKIQTILEAARQASHWGNTWVWRCIVIDKKRASRDVIKAAVEGGYDQVQVQQAPLILYFVVDRAKWSGWIDSVKELYESLTEKINLSLKNAFLNPLRLHVSKKQNLLS